MKGNTNLTDEKIGGAIKIIETSFNNVSISANSLFAISKAISVPTGYTAIGVTGIDAPRKANYVYSRAKVNNGNVEIGGYNGTSDTQISATVYILCVKSGFIG